MDGAVSETRSLSASRRHSVIEASPPKDGEMISSTYRKSSKLANNGMSSLSTKDLFPMTFKEKTGTQLVVKMSGQGITTKRLTSAR